MRAVIVFVLWFAVVQTAPAQITRKVKKAAERGAERTLERRVEKESSKKTDEVLDKVFEEKPAKKQEGGKEAGEAKPGDKKGTAEAAAPGTNRQEGSGAGFPETGKAPGNSLGSSRDEWVTGSTFFPNGQVIYSEDFGKDAVEDFPAAWETSSGGEVITINGKKALRFYPNGVYLAGNGRLPENYALEFDLTTQNLAYKGSSGSAFDLIFSDERGLAKTPANGARFRLPLWYKAGQHVLVSNWGKGVSKIDNKIDFALDSRLNTTTHYTVVVNGRRLRVYLDNQKVVDLPSLLQNSTGRSFAFYLWGTKPEEYDHIVAVSNIKITEEGQDLRSMILKGGFSTTQILFASGSDKIQASSYGFLDELATTLNANTEFKLLIIGHTDSDGEEAANRALSGKRAESVKSYLAGKGVAADRLQTEGKGEGEPVAPNTTPEGKAQNRRVEFVRQ
ncbi:MAG: OmpA family protein [Leadbetterella sp.]|nr:OmpA family protein [Leadbetterella sp.]